MTTETIELWDCACCGTPLESSNVWESLCLHCWWAELTSDEYAQAKQAAENAVASRDEKESHGPGSGGA